MRILITCSSGIGREVYPKSPIPGLPLEQDETGRWWLSWRDDDAGWARAIIDAAGHDIVVSLYGDELTAEVYDYYME